MPQCQAITEKGSRCRLPALSTSEHCLNHDPEYHEQQRANAAAAGRASGVARRLQPIDLDFVSLAERTSIQGLLDTLFRMELLGTLPPPRARLLVRILSLAIRNFDRPVRTSPNDATKATHEPATYDRTRNEFEELAAAVVSALADNDDLTLARQLSAESARRRQKWTDEEAFDRVPRALETRGTPARPQTSGDAWEESFRDHPSPPDPLSRGRGRGGGWEQSFRDHPSDSRQPTADSRWPSEPDPMPILERLLKGHIPDV
ncbi:MAG: hypothetical protein HY875_09175 [Chloroflexi bacterium]|nr:hypothetical protein [Chloroflexota bacterium]